MRARPLPPITRRRAIAALAGPLVGAAAAPGGAQTAWPSRAVRLVVPLPPGGSPDLCARVLGERLQPLLGQPIVVENRVGANGGIAREFVARQPADGHTLLMTESAHVMTASFSRLSYDAIRDFTPIAPVARTPFVLAVTPALGVNSVAELIALARARPGQLNYGSSGTGAPHHFAVEMLRSLTGIDVVHVPYKGSAAMVPALLSGEIAFVVGGVNSLLPHLAGGRLKALAVAGSARTAALPEVPTLAEAGPLPGYAMDVWVGLVGPAGLPRPVVERLSTEVAQLLREGEPAAERLRAAGLDPWTGGPERLAAAMQADLDKFTRIARDARMKAD
ncbi:tripartite tricarboxylate transporter substrate binding protein [Aquabacterium sp. J223]|uniref:Bug family tripartite tricarboxylate transporter substrate binding protein n=1 Tax=Aquabacterium sp. J223 TaxID=2898431 RepID=UPI0021ADA3BC|nr:tripartite tricarboxylate transporter substrate binding protein [Aquabacterium sp. J223]UUX95449.1 tripartite tricarboxylate transporter substrate binding protein [Aquabacterium sp. J223]